MRRLVKTSGLAVSLISFAFALSMGSAAARGPDRQRAPTPTPTPPVDLLNNGDFEAGFARQWNAVNNEWANGRVALGWMAWWRKPTAPDEEYPARCPEDVDCLPWHAPEYRETQGIPYTPPRVRSGDNSQMYFTSFGLHEGGLYQKVSGVPQGWRVRFNIWARAWSSDTEDTTESSGQQSMNLQAGIDPTGGVDPWSDQVIWSEAGDSFDAFGEFSLEVVARADTLTVFFRSRPERALKHIDVMLDDAELILIGPPPPTPVVIDSPNVAAGAPTLNAPAGRIVIHVVQPGDTLFAIAQTYRADLAAIYALNDLSETSVLKVGQTIRIPLPVESAPTPVPTSAPPPPPAVGAVCVRAFEDAGGDGRYDAGDAALSGAAFIVTDDAGATVASTNAARCFADLAVGVYAVAAQLPAGYAATTDTRWGVALIEGAQVKVTVGARRIEASETSDVDASGAQAIAIGAGVILVAAIIGVRLRLRRP